MTTKKPTKKPEPAKAVEKKAELSYCTGNMYEVVLSLDRSLKMFMRSYKEIKVDITGRSPQVRFKEHLMSRDWDRMVVKYKSSSQNYVNQIEDFFVEKHPELKNEWIGQSMLTEKGHNYLYFLLAKKIKK